jgi:hypothetical protein
MQNAGIRPVIDRDEPAHRQTDRQTSVPCAHSDVHMLQLRYKEFYFGIQPIYLKMAHSKSNTQTALLAPNIQI